MSERIHILRPDSITPIERCLKSRRAGAADYKAQVSFACVAWLAELGDPPYESAAACFFCLLEAVEEMMPRKR